MKGGNKQKQPQQDIFKNFILFSILLNNLKIKDTSLKFTTHKNPWYVFIEFGHMIDGINVVGTYSNFVRKMVPGIFTLKQIPPGKTNN